MLLAQLRIKGLSRLYLVIYIKVGLVINVFWPTFTANLLIQFKVRPKSVVFMLIMVPLI